MGQFHPSTPAQRAQWVHLMLTHAHTYGFVTDLSRQIGVSRQTLYTWRERGRRALEAAFMPPPAPPPSHTVTATTLARQILTLWIHHTSVRDIHDCLAMAGTAVSLATIEDVLTTAYARACAWMQSGMPSTPRALALDEIYGRDRHGAYLHLVDVHSGAVWGSVGPLAADGESWTLVVWDAQDRGLCWDRVVMDGGLAVQHGCALLPPTIVVQRDHWHVEHAGAIMLARLARHTAALVAQTATVTRQAARRAAGQRPRGRTPKSDLAQHQAEVQAAQQCVADVRALLHEWHDLLGVVVVSGAGVRTAAERAADQAAWLRLLEELRDHVPPRLVHHVEGWARAVTLAWPMLWTFVPQVDAVQQELQGSLPPAHQALLAWAWQRRHVLGWTSADVVAAVPPTWHAAARMLLATWDDAVRVSSAVERWHSIMRPQLAVRRTLTTGMLALLAVWHNHRVFRRGIHKGKNPLHLSGIADAPTDWMAVLGFPADPDANKPVVSAHLPTTALRQAA